jgi:hypothetical protein
VDVIQGHGGDAVLEDETGSRGDDASLRCQSLRREHPRWAGKRISVRVRNPPSRTAALSKPLARSSHQTRVAQCTSGA